MGHKGTNPRFIWKLLDSIDLVELRKDQELRRMILGVYLPCYTCTYMYHVIHFGWNVILNQIARDNCVKLSLISLKAGLTSLIGRSLHNDICLVFNIAKTFQEILVNRFLVYRPQTPKVFPFKITELNKPTRYIDIWKQALSCLVIWSFV